MTLAVLVAFTFGAAGATTEFVNKTVEFEDADDTLTIEAHWLEDSDGSTEATFTVYNETEYQNDSANATVVTDGVLSNDPGNTTSAEISTNTTGIEAETEYRLVVEGDDAHLEDVELSGAGTGNGGAVFTSDTQRNAAIVGVILVAGALLMTREE